VSSYDRDVERPEPADPTDTDRDLAALEEAERELAELEIELERADGGPEHPEG
jgi:hypothetical protein